jgi:hypothetical protein
MSHNRPRYAPEQVVKPMQARPPYRYPEYYHHADAYTVKRVEELPGDLNAMKVGLILGGIVAVVIWAVPFVELWWQS